MVELINCKPRSTPVTPNTMGCSDGQFKIAVMEMATYSTTMAMPSTGPAASTSSRRNLRVAAMNTRMVAAAWARVEVCNTGLQEEPLMTRLYTVGPTSGLQTAVNAGTASMIVLPGIASSRRPPSMAPADLGDNSEMHATATHTDTAKPSSSAFPASQPLASRCAGPATRMPRSKVAHAQPSG